MKEKTLTLITWSIFLVIGLMAGLYIEGHRDISILDSEQYEIYHASFIEEVNEDGFVVSELDPVIREAISVWQSQEEAYSAGVQYGIEVQLIRE